MIYTHLFMFITAETLMHLHNRPSDDMHTFHDEYVLFMVCENTSDNII